MNIAVGIGTMLLGGWVLTSPAEQENLAPQYSPPPSPSASQPAAGPHANPYESRSMDERSYRNMMEGERGTQYQRKSGQPASRAQQPGGGAVPTSPTEGGAMNMPLPPTADQSSLGPGVGGMDQPLGPAGQQMPAAPTAAGPAPSGGRPSGGMQRPSYSSGARPSIGGGSTRSNQKAFSSYNPYSSGVSPYMNLFRRGDGGVVDNYTTLVRPALEQRAANQRFNMDIYGLERRERIQQSSLQQMQQNQRALQGVGTPQYYMNYGGYYGNQ